MSSSISSVEYLSMSQGVQNNIFKLVKSLWMFYSFCLITIKVCRTCFCFFGRLGHWNHPPSKVQYIAASWEGEGRSCVEALVSEHMEDVEMESKQKGDMMEEEEEEIREKNFRFYYFIIIIHIVYVFINPKIFRSSTIGQDGYDLCHV